MSTDTQEASQVKPHQWTDGGEHVLILRRINKDGTSYGGFRWPDGTDVEVECPDWNPRPVCGGGLHGWPWGMALGEGSDYSLIEDRWLVIACRPEDVIGEIEGGCKCKFRRGTKFYDGPFSGAWNQINSGRHRLIEAMSKEGDEVASGTRSTAASSGSGSTAASSGSWSTAASSGSWSTAASSGSGSTAASSGSGSKAASSGSWSKAASSGSWSKAASSGNGSTAASSGNWSKAEVEGEDCLAAVAGLNGRVKCGETGAFAVAYRDANDEVRFLCGKPGENGIKADTWYRVENGKLVEVE